MRNQNDSLRRAGKDCGELENIQRTDLWNLPQSIPGIIGMHQFPLRIVFENADITHFHDGLYALPTGIEMCSR